MGAWSRKTLKKCKCLRLCRKTTPYGEVFKILFWKDSSRHPSTCCVQISWNLADGKSVKSCVAYLRKTKLRLVLQFSLLRGSRPKSARATPPPTRIYWECSRFHLNRFTFGRVIPERVNTVKARSKVKIGWRLKPSFKPNNYVTDTHRALIPTCRHSLKVRSGWCHSSCRIRTVTLIFDCLGVLLVPKTLVALYASVLQAVW